MNTLTLGGRLFDTSGNRVAMEVTSATLTMGRIGVLETNSSEERWTPYEEVRAWIDMGELEVRRKGNPQLAGFLDRNDKITCKRKRVRRPALGSAEDSYQSSLARATRIVRTLNEYRR